ncbi:MAG: DUF4825 domain-containing protein [Lachnospiraceae bacterium]|nr:DUF4825 domain-containing protein [Lachnospiraceae bacterium]
MSAKIRCHIIKDLLPLYLDDLVSEETGAEIKQHLLECPDCSEYYEHMKSDFLEKQRQKQEENQKEINYLKKIKKTTNRKVLLGTVLTLFACLFALAVKLFIIGSPNESYYTTYVNDGENSIYVGGVFMDSSSVYSRYKIKKTKEGSRLVIYTCLPLPWNRNGAFNLDIPKNEIHGSLSIGEITAAEDGTIISAMANKLYQNKNPYIGDASANGRLSAILGISNELGSFKNELQTSKEPYGWTLHFENSALNSAVFDEKMKGFSCVLIALTDNLGEVTWNYTVELADGPVTRTRTMTEETCSAYLGSPVKNYAKSPEAVQKLLQLLTDEHGINFYEVHEVN